MYSHKADYNLKFDFEAAGVFCRLLNAEFIEVLSWNGCHNNNLKL